MIREPEDTETSPLLGLSTDSQTSPDVPRIHDTDRVHFVDNLRAVLTVIMICHHAAIVSSAHAIKDPALQNTELLPLALFITLNKSTLYQGFFFVSGYSIRLGLSSKSDSAVFVRRLLKTGLPALLWLAFGAHTRGIGQFEGPGSYVFTLLALDSVYLFTRYIGEQLPQASFSRLESRIKDSRKSALGILIMSFILVTGITIGNCFGLRLIPFIHHHYYPFEFPGFGAPVGYIVAYIAGVNFPVVQRYILFKKPSVAAAHSVGSEMLAHISLGAAQHYSRSLRQFILPSFDSEGARFFVDAGWNAHTIFFGLWSPLAMYIVNIAFISVFATIPVLKKDWGVLTEHTYLQTYIHMFAVVFATDAFRRHFVGWPVTEALVGSVTGIVGSWIVALAFVAARRRLVHRPHLQLQGHDNSD